MRGGLGLVHFHARPSYTTEVIVKKMDAMFLIDFTSTYLFIERAFTSLPHSILFLLCTCSVIIPSKAPGEEVNIEVDVLAKLVESSMSSYAGSLLAESPLVKGLAEENGRLRADLAALQRRVDLLENKA